MVKKENSSVDLSSDKKELQNLRKKYGVWKDIEHDIFSVDWDT